jgi:beta-galactosidase/beta-glucuronidase
MSRVKLSLNGAWEFVPDPKDQFRPDALPERMSAIEVPGNWEAQFPAEAGVFGRAWYRRVVETPAEWRGRAVFLHFGAVNYYCQVWVNGHFVGDHEGGYTPFRFRIDPFLDERRETEIVVKVVHPAHATPSFPEFSYQEIAGTLQDMFGYSIGEIPLGKQNWYGSVSGIWQGVYLEVVYPTFFTSLLITPDIDRSVALVRVGLHEPPLNAKDLCLCYRILDRDGNQVAERKGVTVAEALGESPSPDRALHSPFVEVPVPDRRLWTLDDPHLYRLEATLEAAASRTPSPRASACGRSRPGTTGSC